MGVDALVSRLALAVNLGCAMDCDCNSMGAVLKSNRRDNVRVAEDQESRATPLSTSTSTLSSVGGVTEGRSDRMGNTEILKTR
ncbi:hypothetical protein MRB53_037931 [Persea americana]|nr:hypothetical protein MRB53_037931 [Persea americana]